MQIFLCYRIIELSRSGELEYESLLMASSDLRVFICDFQTSAKHPQCLFLIGWLQYIGCFAIVGTIAFDIAVQINIKQRSVDNSPTSIVEQTYTGFLVSRSQLK